MKIALAFICSIILGIILNKFISFSRIESNYAASLIATSLLSFGYAIAIRFIYKEITQNVINKAIFIFIMGILLSTFIHESIYYFGDYQHETKRLPFEFFILDYIIRVLQISLIGPLITLLVLLHFKRLTNEYAND